MLKNDFLEMDELSTNIYNWEDPNPPPILEEYNGFVVVRDDLLEGGSKIRFADYLISSQPEIKEWVYGSSPATGYAQISLACLCKKYGKKAGTAAKKQYEKVRPSEETKKDKADIENKNATTSAKKLMIESYENETLTKEEIDAIKGSGRDNKINRKDVSLAIKKKERVAPKEEKQETEEVKKKR